MAEPLDYHGAAEEAMPTWPRVHGWLVVAMGPVAVLALAVATYDRFLNYSQLDRYAPAGYAPIVLAAFFSPVLIIAARRHWLGLFRRDRHALQTTLVIETVGAAFVAFGVFTTLAEILTSGPRDGVAITICLAILVADSLVVVGILRTRQWLKTWPQVPPEIGDDA